MYLPYVKELQVGGFLPPQKIKTLEKTKST